MNLNAQQVAAIKEGEPVRFVPAEIGEDCVVLRADVYDRVQELIRSEAEFHPRETYQAVLKVLDQDDESPEQYLEYLND